MNGARRIVRSLVRQGVTSVFELPGGSIVHLLHELSNTPGIDHVTFRHEQAAAFAADAYARVSGKPGVCMVTSGPGVTNVVTGIANAFLDSVPLVVISGQVRTTELKGSSGTRQSGFQEVDAVGLCRDITKAAITVSSCAEIEEAFDFAFALATRERPGPVLVDVPKDVQTGDAVSGSTKSFSLPPTLPVSEDVIGAMEGFLRKSQRPLLLVGGGAVPVASDVRQMVATMGIPVAYSLLGKGVVSDRSEACLGMLGWHGSRQANWAVQQADLILAFGIRLNVRQTGTCLEHFAPRARIVRVDADPNELAARIQSELPVCADSRDVVPRLVQRLEGYRCPADWHNCNRAPDVPSRFRPEYGDSSLLSLFDTLSKYTEKAIVTTDVGQHQMWAAQLFASDRARTFVTSAGLGAMGYGLPAAIGACFAEPERLVLCITGDGSFQLNLQELQVVQYHRLPIKIVLLDNSCLGMVRLHQVSMFGDVCTSTGREGGYSTPDFKHIAKAYGLHYRRVGPTDRAEEVIPPLMESPAPCLIHVPIDRDLAVHPALERGRKINEQLP